MRRDTVTQGSVIMGLAAHWLGNVGRVGLICCLFTGIAAPGALAQGGMPAWSPFYKDRASYQSGTYFQEHARRVEANPPRGLPTLSRDNIEATKVAIKTFEKLVKDGGWGSVDTEKLRPGANSESVRRLHGRLLASGHLKQASYMPSQFGYEIEEALTQFQMSNGLSPTGMLDRRTIAALNIPAKTRLAQLRINLRRLQANAKSKKSRYLVVNIPAAQIEAVEGDSVISRHAGVVGKIDRRTPILSSRVHEINFNPVWHLPPTVISEDLIPKGREMQKAGEDVLTKFGIDAYSGARKLDPTKINWSSSQPQGLSYRQPPGNKNPLGFAKINFHNDYSVYLHDTPSDSIFGRNFRAASSGCVRVENIETLLAWLLESNADWDTKSISEIRDNGKTKTVGLKKPVPLHMVYITAWALPDGTVHFRRDLYQRDGAGNAAASY